MKSQIQQTSNRMYFEQNANKPGYCKVLAVSAIIMGVLMVMDEDEGRRFYSLAEEDNKELVQFILNQNNKVTKRRYCQQRHTNLCRNKAVQTT